MYKTLCSGLGVAAVLTGLLLPGLAAAKVSPEEAAQLGIEGTPLTPTGAIRAGNADGTIPAWTGGITQWPAGYKDGGWYVNPFADDKILFTINAQNVAQYADKVTKGQRALMEKYPDYFMNIYPTRRSFSNPQRIYEGSMKNATEAYILPEPEFHGVHQPYPGIPFPIPQDGKEAMWSHNNWYRGDKYIWTNAVGWNVSAGGDAVLHTVRQEAVEYRDLTPEDKQRYAGAGGLFERDGGVNWGLVIDTTSPARIAGSVVCGINFLHQAKFRAYAYVPGQRRVRKAPELGFHDGPGVNSDGLRLSDERYQFLITGGEDRYTFKSNGRKEMFVSVNNYDLSQPTVDLKSLLLPGHMKQDLVRYELHRVWEIEMEKKEGVRHQSHYRVMWADEDSWAGTATDVYDTKRQLWKVGEAYNMNFYNVPVEFYWGENHFDLSNGRYSTINAWFNQQEAPPDFKTWPEAWKFTPAGLRKMGKR